MSQVYDSKANCKIPMHYLILPFLGSPGFFSAHPIQHLYQQSLIIYEFYFPMKLQATCGNGVSIMYLYNL